ncbi:hypothetical protein HYC85_031169 [Camellia sinensis]|uniref:Uncharacterized protein n=1 Tax=Camellia sinensis TaxID=4442 RepID=A0A7J7FTE4_CAMSI|nr:hypothetical protein HYC85_031169 [Camellia sinensis]
MGWTGTAEIELSSWSLIKVGKIHTPHYCKFVTKSTENGNLIFLSRNYCQRGKL